MPWRGLTGVLPLLPLLVLLASFLAPEQRLRLLAHGEEPLLSPPLALQSGWLGSPELELKADLPANSTAVLAVELLDASGRPVLQFQKDAWRERGIWMEEGEQGLYDEGDTAALLGLRPDRSGPYQLRVQVEDLLDAAGQPLSASLPLLLTVRQHSVDRPLLGFSFVVASGLLALHWCSLYGGCRRRLRWRVEEHQLAERLDVGGPGLVWLGVSARYERGEGPLRRLQIPLELRLSDAWGRSLLHQRLPLPLSSSGSGDAVWRVAHGLWLRVPEPHSLRVQVTLDSAQAGPGLELAWLELLVEDGRVSPWPVQVTPLQPAAVRPRAGGPTT